MKRAFLEELGIEKATIDKIMSEHGNDIEKYKGSLADVQEERDELKEKLAESGTKIEALQTESGNSAKLQKQIEKLQADNKSIRVNAAVERALTSAKAKSIKAVLPFLDVKDAEIGEDGVIAGLAEQIEAVKKDNAFLFDSDTVKVEKPTIKGAVPGEPSDDKPAAITEKQFAKMSYKERAELYNTDKDLYDSLKGGIE